MDLALCEESILLYENKRMTVDENVVISSTFS